MTERRVSSKAYFQGRTDGRAKARRYERIIRMALRRRDLTMPKGDPMILKGWEGILIHDLLEAMADTDVRAVNFFSQQDSSLFFNRRPIICEHLAGKPPAYHGYVS